MTTDYEGHALEQIKPRVTSRNQVAIDVKPEDFKSEALTKKKRIQKLRHMQQQLI